MRRPCVHVFQRSTGDYLGGWYLQAGLIGHGVRYMEGEVYVAAAGVEVYTPTGRWLRTLPMPPWYDSDGSTVVVPGYARRAHYVEVVGGQVWVISSVESGGVQNRHRLDPATGAEHWHAYQGEGEYANADLIRSWHVESDGSVVWFPTETGYWGYDRFGHYAMQYQESMDRYYPSGMPAYPRTWRPETWSSWGGANNGFHGFAVDEDTHWVIRNTTDVRGRVWGATPVWLRTPMADYWGRPNGTSYDNFYLLGRTGNNLTYAGSLLYLLADDRYTVIQRADNTTVGTYGTDVLWQAYDIDAGADGRLYITDQWEDAGGPPPPPPPPPPEPGARRRVILWQH